MNQFKVQNSKIHHLFSGERLVSFNNCGDTEFYDFINRYLVEEGSDGVIRLSAANLNYKVLQLEQDCSDDAFDTIVDGHIIKAYPLKQLGKIQTSPASAFEVIPNVSHSGKIMGIMQSVKLKNDFAPPLVNSIINSLRISTNKQYNTLLKNMHKQNKRTQKDNQKCDRYIMFVFSIKDNFGNEVSDYDMLLLAGKKYKPSTLPKGFFLDKQKNRMSGALVYYLNYDKLKKIKDGKFGIRIVARPDKGFSHYITAEFRSEDIDLHEFLNPNETVMINVVLQRQISKNSFVLDKIGESQSDEGSFKSRGIGSVFIE